MPSPCHCQKVGAAPPPTARERQGLINTWLKHRCPNFCLSRGYMFHISRRRYGVLQQCPVVGNGRTTIPHKTHTVSTLSLPCPRLQRLHTQGTSQNTPGRAHLHVSLCKNKARIPGIPVFLTTHCNRGRLLWKSAPAILCNSYFFDWVRRTH